jgi:hypothetical protein
MKRNPNLPCLNSQHYDSAHDCPPHHTTAMNERIRTMGCLLSAFLLVATGTLLTGVLPSGWGYQAVAGTIIVAGFAVPVVCFGPDTFIPEPEE